MKLTEWRRANNVSIVRMAELSGLSHSTISLIESGKRKAGKSAAIALEAATNGAVPASQLMGLSSSARNESGVREAGPAVRHENELVSITVPGHLAQAASDLGINMQDKLREGGLPALRQAVTDTFLTRHKAEIDWTRDYVERHGTLSQRFGMI